MTIVIPPLRDIALARVGEGEFLPPADENCRTFVGRRQRVKYLIWNKL
jgi:hypothetical protein